MAAKSFRGGFDGVFNRAEAYSSQRLSTRSAIWYASAFHRPAIGKQSLTFEVVRRTDMTQPELDRQILPFLESEDRFDELSKFFTTKLVDELCMDAEGMWLRPYVQNGVTLLVEKCHRTVSTLSGSPIERIFARSVMLSFLRNGLPLVYMPGFRNTHTDIGEYHEQLKHLDDFTNWYAQYHGSTVVSVRYLDEQVASGRMPKEERPWIEELLLLYHNLPWREAWHVSLQPWFPRLSGKRGIRPDMLFWKPSLPARRLVVECDGYSFHRYPNSFVADRKRDRALKSLGYDTFRFSGREINTDPVMIAHELFLFLDDW